MTIKLVRMFGHLSPLEPRLGKKLVDPLTQVMSTTPAKSLLYECIRTVTKGMSNHTSLVRLAVEKLRDFVDEPDPNLKFLGLRALSDLLSTHPRAVAEHKKTIFRCLQEGDFTIQLTALQLIQGMATRRNLSDTVAHLLLILQGAEQPFRDHLVGCILNMCQADRYARLSDFSWYVTVLADLARVPESNHGKSVGAQLVDVTTRVEAAREDAVQVSKSTYLHATAYFQRHARGRSDRCLQTLPYSKTSPPTTPSQMPSWQQRTSVASMLYMLMTGASRICNLFAQPVSQEFGSQCSRMVL
eukprot:1181512-Prorocentrum_minimum.AAC.4